MSQEVTVRKGDVYVGIEIKRPNFPGSIVRRHIVKVLGGFSLRTADNKYVRTSDAR